MKMPTKDQMRARAKELASHHDALVAELMPLREELNRLAAGDTELSVKAWMEREAEVRAAITGYQDKLLPIMQESSMIARALGGYALAAQSG